MQQACALRAVVPRDLELCPGNVPCSRRRPELSKGTGEAVRPISTGGGYGEIPSCRRFGMTKGKIGICFALTAVLAASCGDPERRDEDTLQQSLTGYGNAVMALT